LIRYTKRYLGNEIPLSKNSGEESQLPKVIKKVVECISTAIVSISDPGAVLALSQFFMIVAPVYMLHEVTGHLIRIYKELKIEENQDNKKLSHIQSFILLNLFC